jgi:two-component system, NtrC family, response regulator AtoC
MQLLIVDDDADLRHSLGLLLTEAGHAVTVEGDPERGLTRAVTENFDVILCDVRMPRVDGLAFLRRYRADGGSALLLMMSAFGKRRWPPCARARTTISRSRSAPTRCC